MPKTQNQKALCTCSKCILNSVYDPQTKTNQHGKYLAPRTIRTHQLQDRKPLVMEDSNSDRSSTNNSAVIHSDTSNGSVFEGPNMADNNLISFIVLFISWLYLFCGVSRENCRTACNFLFKILEEFQKKPAPINQLETLARDPRSLIEKADINPTLIKTICCRECFSLYPPNRDAPLFCTYLPYPNEEQCGEPLFKQNRVYRGMKDLGQFPPKSTTKNPVPYPQFVGVPRCYFISQSILTWVTWLLSKPDTEKEIQEWAGKVGNQDDFLIDVQNGTAFKTLFSKDQSNSLDLALSLFVDWFNPRGNKISGSVESSGVFAFSCLNLPPSTRNKVSHIGLAGITPGPFSPNTETINHLLKPFVDELIQLESGVEIRTYQYPNGRTVRIKLLCLLGDAPAVKKVAGFASHSAKYFCSFCKEKLNDLGMLQRGPNRSKDATLAAAQLAKDSKSSTESENLLKESGVRWSELNRLSYWNPSDNIVLGVLHNWLEGILQAHFRYRWGFKSITKKESEKRRRSAYAQSRRKRARLGGAASAMSLDETSENSRLEDSSDESDTDLVLDGGPDGSFFSQNDIETFRRSMKEVILPHGLDKLPPNLGEESHGRLKASQWFTLFSYIIPLVIFDLYITEIGNIDSQPKLSNFLFNTGNLVSCTRIICSRKINDLHIKRFESHYRKYSDTVGELFKGVKVQPNHHYALHYTTQLRRWGPVVCLSEFPGERLIGFLQKIKTNNLIDQMNATMMTRGCQLQKMIDKPGYKEFLQTNGENNKSQTAKSPASIYLSDAVYGKLFSWVRRQHPSLRHRDEFPIPRGLPVLSGYATPVQSVLCGDVRVSCLEPQNCVVAKLGGKLKYGIVKQIYMYKNHLEEIKHVIFCSPIVNLYPKRLNLPTTRFRFSLYQCAAVVGKLDWDEDLLLEPANIDSVAAYRFLPRNTFSIESNGIILTPYNRSPLLELSGSS
ncbi:hypothetical protein PGTUg99_050062 [Puccinia graminis f. sp. tritici]|uniref:Transposase domain-containing protein n=1 Tax=Puccinia graminis f. sp. tritici TaxID=56615 RepID=A0A5B0RDP3_PUCGR|nr:hypothetical protein PGTUg99_050062 [Puccinia graminis f. sp. tritici]